MIRMQRKIRYGLAVLLVIIAATGIYLISPQRATIRPGSLIDTINTGGSPDGIAASPDGNFIYVTDASQSGHVWVISTVNNTMVHTIYNVGYPFEISLTPNGKYAYVSSGNVSIIDLTNETVIKTIKVADGYATGGVAVLPDGKYVYVGSFGNVSVISTSNNTVVKVINLTPSLPDMLAFTPNGAYAYVTNPSSNTVAVISTSNYTVVKTIKVGKTPEGIAITPDGTFAYVANLDSNNVSVISTSNNTD